ncbi:nitrate- and nitrite sensing domain-containing protein [Streptomyces sodiiphilus]|uniref:histidine kinase n=1 Tax=Streptomyces sodiiphilus TaxID=226217 RepID=A0ABP5AHS5_9ACTN
MQGRFKREGSAAGDAELSGETDRGSSAERAPGGDLSAADGAEPGNGSAENAESVAPRRPSHAGSRMALRNWRISTRLVSLIALPVVAATALGALRIQSSMENIEQLDNMQLLTDMTQQATLLAAALQEERDRSAGPLVSGRSPKSDEVAAPRERTDAARLAFSEATLAIDADDEVMQGVQATVVDITRQLNQIKEIRDGAYQDPEYVSQTITRYNELIDALLSLSQDMAQATSNSEMIRSTRALAAFSAAKEHASIQRAVITAGLARDELDDDQAGLSGSDWRFGRTHHEAERARLNSFIQIYASKERSEELLDPLEGGVVNIAAATQYADTVFSSEDSLGSQPLTYRDWYDQYRTKIDAMDRIEQTLLAEMEEQARALRNDAQRDAIFNGALIVLVLGVSLVGAFVVARSMVRSLRRLQDTAQEVARKRLPEVVKQMSEADPQEVDTSVESVGVHTRDEIGQVAQAFDDVHREAVRLAGEQALLRGNVNAMFTNLSRRSQGLIQRQLSLISELESREADPDQLSSLFKLDHLATRMRRNGENLLVLAGEEPGRRWTRPVPLVDVLRAAASEVEQYERIELSAVPKTEVAGRVVNDLVHLLAELLENATSFSSPQTKVKVTGHALPDGRVLVEIHDTGIGLSPEDLAEINDRLANPPTVDVSVSRRMGLFVVGRLSLRHGIRIQLRPSDTGGTTALVMLPAEVAQGGPGGPGRTGAPASGAAGNGAQATTTLQRESAPPRRAGGEQQVGSGPARGQVPGTPERPALPSRPGGASGPGTPGGRSGPGSFGGAPSVPEQGPGGVRGGPAAGRPPAGGQRPSWANEDTGQIPVGRDMADGPRGHDEPSTGEYARPAGPSLFGSAPGDRMPPPPERYQQPAPGDSAGYGSRSGYGQEQSVFGDGQDLGRGRPQGAGQDYGQAQDRPEYGGGQTGEYPAPAQPQPRRAPEELPPAPAEPQRAPERTPIFEEMESTWFGRARRIAEAPPAVSSRESAGSPPPRPTAPEGARPGPSASASPPAAQRQTESAQPAAQNRDSGAQWRPSPNDERWRQAEQLRQPAAGGVTTSGLPKRVPRANLVAGTAQTQQSTPTGPQVSRAPSDVRGRLTNLRRGIQQGRQAGSGAGHPDRDLGPTYQQER